jgi:hypothetical protein
MAHSRSPRARTAAAVRSALAQTEQRIAVFHAAGHVQSAANYERDLPRLRAELARAESREPMQAVVA